MRSKKRLTVHGNATDDILAEMLRDLKDKLLAVVLGLKGVQDRRELGSVELDCRKIWLAVAGRCD